MKTHKNGKCSGLYKIDLNSTRRVHSTICIVCLNLAITIVAIVTIIILNYCEIRKALLNIAVF